MPSTSALKERKKESKKDRTKEQRELTQNQNKKFIFLPIPKNFAILLLDPRRGIKQPTNLNQNRCVKREGGSDQNRQCAVKICQSKQLRCYVIYKIHLFAVILQNHI